MIRLFQDLRLGLMVSGHVLLLVGNVVFVVVHGPPSADWFVSWFLAAPFVQVSLTALWSTWGHPMVSRRIPTAMVGLAVVSLVLSGLYGGASAWGQMPLWITGLAVQWLVIQVPLAASRALLGYRLEKLDDGHRVSLSEVQFSLRELFLWTAAIAVLLGLARWAVTLEASRAGGVSEGEVLFFGFLLVSNAGLTLAASVGTLVPRFWLVCLPVMTLLCAGLTWTEWRAAEHLFGADDAAVLAWLNGFQFPLLMLSLLVFRTAGYRLTRVHV